ncbi:MAG: flavodoxin family protein [Desulfobacteraceae bacterium]
MNAKHETKQNSLSGHFPKPKIIGVGGSPRKNGNSDVLLKQALDRARESNVLTEKIHLRDYQFQPCIGCEKCRKDKICSGLNDGMSLLYPKIMESQGLVLVCPTHNYNVTAWMKAFIDRLYCFYVFDDNRPRGWSSRLAGQGRKAAIIAVCEQVNKKDMGFTLEAMRLPIKALGYEIIGELAVLGVFDRGKVKEKKKTLVRASKLGADLAKSILM